MKPSNDAPNHYSFANRPPNPGITFPEGSSKTVQSFKDETDINLIVKRFIRTGELPAHVKAGRQAVFTDVSDVGSYHDALLRLQTVQDAFNGLPADLRKHFDNDPAQLLAFCDQATPAELEQVFAGKVPTTPEPPPAAPEGTKTETPK